MTLGEILKDGLQVFGIPNVTSAPQAALDRILTGINETLQKLESEGGDEFFTRQEETVTLAADTQEYTLSKNIQTVLKPARLSDGTMLRELTSRGQLLQFGQIFKDQLSGTVAAGKPSAYFAESLRDAADVTGDSVAIVVHVLPKPTTAWAAAVTLVLDVIKQPAQVTAGQLSTGTAVLELPHKYVESIFLPLLRRNLTRSYLFSDKNKLAGIEEDAQRAMGMMVAREEIAEQEEAA